jgi:addiction module HigA family antidote
MKQSILKENAMAKKKVPAPADVLKKIMDDYGLKTEQVAEGVKMVGSSIRMILCGKVRISLPTAFRLAKFFGTPAQFWIDAQLEYDIAELKNDQELQDDLKSITKVKIKKNAKSSSSSKKSDAPVKKAASARPKKAVKPRVEKGV